MKTNIMPTLDDFPFKAGAISTANPTRKPVVVVVGGDFPDAEAVALMQDAVEADDSVVWVAKSYMGLCRAYAAFRCIIAARPAPTVH